MARHPGVSVYNIDILLVRLSYNEFVQKYGRDERFKAVEKSRDREAYFSDHASEMKRREKEERAHSREKVSQA